MDNADLFLRLAVSLAIGLLIGVERAWHQREDQNRRAAGIRTFALVGLIGGISGILGQVLGPIVTALAFVGFAGVFFAFQWREAEETQSVGATTSIAGLTVFLLGALASVGDIQTAVAAGIAMAALLALRDVLHSFVAGLSWVEVRDGLILLAMAFLLLPLLPDTTLDPWDALNPRALWIIAVILASISYAGWIAVRALGERWGILLTAAVGGLASSTATTATLARLGRLPGAQPRHLAAGMCLSGAVSLMRIAVLAGVLDPTLVRPLALPYGCAIVALLGGSLWLLRNALKSPTSQPFSMKSPVDLISAMQMVAILAGVSLIAGLLRTNFGDSGLYVVAAISGLVDLDAITITVARLGAAQNVQVQTILLATAVNLTVKAILATTLGGPAIARAFWPPTLLAIALGAAATTFLPLY